jgi:ATP synthase protein I
MKQEDAQLKPALDDLGQRIAQKQMERAEGPEDNNKPPSGGRVACELAAAVAVGGFFGYYLDDWLDTKPIFFIIMTFLGVAAGVLNIYKLAVKNAGADFSISEETVPDEKK